MLTGLTAAPAQAFGGIRLVPLLRADPVEGLRLHPQVYGDDEISVAKVGKRAAYAAFVPHAFVASWGSTVDESPSASYGTLLTEATAAARPDSLRLRFHKRMARRDGRRRLRFLPLHLALEGYLALHFGGPTIVWEDWTNKAVREGLSPRMEAAYTGAQVTGLEDALRMFEIHEHQVGVMVYVADALAAAFVVPHPTDYRVLHPSLLRDLYGELIYQYGYLFPDVSAFTVNITDATSVEQLRAELAREARDWHAFHAMMGIGLLDAPYTEQMVYTLGEFTLSRFLPAFDPTADNHIGERIVDRAGNLAYLKTFRLSAAQTRRGHLLGVLAAHDWNVELAAGALGTDRQGLATRLDRAGFTGLLRNR